MNWEKPNHQICENLDNDKKDCPNLSSKKPENISLSGTDLEQNNEKRMIEEVKQKIDKTFKPEPFNESLVLQKLKEASNIIYDMGALPLSVDSTYQMISEWLTAQCEETVEVFFKKAREGTAEEKLRYSTALMQLGMVADGKTFNEALKHNLKQASHRRIV